MSDLPQAPTKHDMYMNFTKCIKIVQGYGKMHVLKLIRNIYGWKQDGQVCNIYLTKKLLIFGIQQSAIDKCILFRGCPIFAWYIEDGIFASLFKEEINQVIQYIGKYGFYIKDDVYIKGYIEVMIDRTKDGKTNLSQPQSVI